MPQHPQGLPQTLPGGGWQQNDGDADSLPSIEAWCAEVPNVLQPRRLDVAAVDWPGVPARVDAIYCANLLHIAPWACCGGLMDGAARHLVPGGLLITYGPYLVDDTPTAASNLAFDADLRTRNPAWGLRALADVVRVAEAAGLRFVERVPMPANNLLLRFARNP